MPPAEEIRSYLDGAWRLMMGRADGVRLLDISADGFWNSFAAIPLALPVMAANWVGLANLFVDRDAEIAPRLAIAVRLAVIDLGLWIVPLIVLALAARPARIADRFVHYVVASNWASVLLAWLMLPPILLRLVFPGADAAANFLQFIILMISLVLTWRLTNAVLAKGPTIAIAVFAGLFAVWIVTQLVLQSLVGLPLLAPAS